MLVCLELSDFAEESGQVNEIKDPQPRFFHFLPSSQVGFAERCPTVALEQALQLFALFGANPPPPEF